MSIDISGIIQTFDSKVISLSVCFQLRKHLVLLSPCDVIDIATLVIDHYYVSLSYLPFLFYKIKNTLKNQINFEISFFVCIVQVSTRQTEEKLVMNSD